tara:strand:+ start:107 stop:373 length:267 start_codon:yes stop_codon:yes gene_type:complete
MEIDVYHYVEVNNLKGCWAVELSKVKPYMDPDFPYFINVFNCIAQSGNFVVDNTLCSLKPEKIIDGVNGGLSEDSIYVGFWRIKYRQL